MSGDQTNTERIIVLADDLSGAAELAGIAFAHGLSAEVQREFEPHAKAKVIAIDTDSRHLAPAAAAARVREATEQVVETRSAWLFKKVDSVLRGNVRAEIEVMLQVTGQSRALLVPANPSRGRIIRGGRYLIEGLPLDQTPFAHDPQHPRVTSEVFTLLGPKTAEIAVPDVETQSQLEQFAAQCDATTLAAGAADFFTAFLKHRAPQEARGRESLSEGRFPSGGSSTDKDSRPLAVQISAPALLACGSPAAWPARRDACLAAGIPVYTIHETTAASPGRGILLLGVGDQRPEASGEGERGVGSLCRKPIFHQEPHSSIKTHDPFPSESNGETTLRMLAQHAARLSSQLSAKTILAEGGATAAALANEMNWTRFQVVATAPAGVGVLQPLGSKTSNAPLFLIKPGSYPWPPEIWQAFCEAEPNVQSPRSKVQG